MIRLESRPTYGHSFRPTCIVLIHPHCHTAIGHKFNSSGEDHCDRGQRTPRSSRLNPNGVMSRQHVFLRERRLVSWAHTRGESMSRRNWYFKSPSWCSPSTCALPSQEELGRQRCRDPASCRRDRAHGVCCLLQDCKPQGVRPKPDRPRLHQCRRNGPTSHK